MEIYSDNEFKPESARFCIVVTFFCIVSFQLGDIFSAHSFYSEYYCIFGLLVMCFFPLFSFSDIGFNFLKSRVERGVILLSYLFLCLTISLLSSVIVKSKNVFDVNFYMFCFLVLSLVMGAGIGAFFSDKNTVFNANENIVIRGNEIELRKIDIFGILSLKKCLFLELL